MFDVGFSELVLLFVIGLLILGPERLPRVAAQLGRWVARARRTATQLRMQFEREMTMQEIMKQQKKHKPPETPKDTQEKDTQATDAQGSAAPTSSTEPPADAAATAPRPRGDAPHGSAPQPSATEKPAEHVDESH